MNLPIWNRHILNYVTWDYTIITILKYYFDLLRAGGNKLQALLTLTIAYVSVLAGGFLEL